MPELIDRRLILSVLMVTVSMGALDAVSLIHLKVFTGYMTATVILTAVHLVDHQTAVGPGAVAISTYLIGAFVGGRLVRRDREIRKTVADLLITVGALVCASALLWAVNSSGNFYITLMVLAFAMGLQTSATRHARVTELTMPAATVLLHALAHDSTLAGGSGKGARRRATAVGSLFFGAVLGALFARVSVSGAVALVGVTTATAGALLFVRDNRFLKWLETKMPT